MYFCYIDESGNTGGNLKDPDQPYLVLTALMVTVEEIKSIESDMRDLGMRYFGAESRNTDFEFHGDAIYNAGRKKDRYFKQLPLEKRLLIFDQLVEILLSYKEIKLGYVLIDKANYFAKNHIQQTAFQLLMEKVEEHLQGYLDAHCLLIADEQEELEQRLIDDLDHFKQHGTSFGYKSIAIDRIIDSVHFVKSHNNYLMQLSDVMCYLIRKGQTANKALISEYFEQKKNKETTLTFDKWRKEHPHKGLKYFASIYHRIGAKEGYLFSKTFP